MLAPSPSSGDAMYDGCVSIFKIIDDLASHGTFPTVENVSAHIDSLPKSSTSSLAPGDSNDQDDTATEGGEKGREVRVFDIDASIDVSGGGGVVAVVLDAVVSYALYEPSETGEVDELAATFPPTECANDFNIALVRKRLGLPEESLWDPSDPPSDDEE